MKFSTKLTKSVCGKQKKCAHIHACVCIGMCCCMHGGSKENLIVIIATFFGFTAYFCLAQVTAKISVIKTISFANCIATHAGLAHFCLVLLENVQ